MPALAAGTYTDPELARAVSLGIGAYSETDKPVTYAEFLAILDRAVELSNSTKLSEWKTKLSAGRSSAKTLTRFNGMCAVLYAAETLGGEYLKLNTSEDFLDEKLGGLSSETRIDEDIFGQFQSWAGTTIKIEHKKPSFIADIEHIMAAYIYSIGRISGYSGKTLFEYSETKKSMRPSELLTYQEAMLAAVRLCDSEYAPTLTSALDPVLKAATEQKQAILNNSAGITITGTKYYISNKGSDSNNGQSPETAWATIEKVNSSNLKDGDGAFFERGGLWRGEIKAHAGVSYAAYGTGNKPKIYGSPENGTGTDKWKLMSGSSNIWVYYRDIGDIGGIVLNGGEIVAQKTLAFWDKTQSKYFVYDKRTQSWDNGKPFVVNSENISNLTFFNDIKYSDFGSFDDMGRPPFSATGKLYFRCDAGNPSEVYRSIEFNGGTGGREIIMIDGLDSKNNVIDNLCLMYGSHGARLGPASIIQNCEIGYVGGVINMFGDKKGAAFVGTVVSGDGVQMLTESSVLNNYIHDVWDAGITNETVGSGLSRENNVIEGNVIEKCASGILIADFVAQNTGANTATARNIKINKNYILETLYGWGHKLDPHRTGPALVITLSPGSNKGGMSITNNLFYLSADTLVVLDYWTGENKPLFSNNTYVQRAGSDGVYREEVTSSANTRKQRVHYYNSYNLSANLVKYLDSSPVIPNTFSEIPTPDLDSASTWAREGITSALGKGFVPADLQSNYTNVISRQEFCRLAVKWLEYATDKSIDTILSEKGLTRNTNAFSDTQDPAILAAYALDITSGTTAPTATAPGKFTPGGQFSREQAATMVMNTCKAYGADTSHSPASGFEDLNTASSWAVDGINFCYANKIMQGTSTAPLTFSPTITYTREQSILTFNNIKP
jgi:hypothetical protein